MMTSNNLVRILIAILFLLIIGCEKDEADKIEVEIETDKTIYSTDSSEIVSVNVTNRSSQSIFYICTCQIYLEELSNSQIINSWQVHGFEECLGPVEVFTDSSETFDINIQSLIDFEYIYGATFTNAVTYRLRFDLFKDFEFKNMLEDSNIFSNTFMIISD